MAWIIQATLPSGSSFGGQIVYDATTIEVPDDLIRYIESIDITESPKYINKLTGSESKKYRIANSSGDDMDTKISISLVSKLPRYLFNILFSLAHAVNQGGMQLYFRDSLASDRQYTCRWVNAVDFTEHNVLVGNCSIDLLSWKKEIYLIEGTLTHVIHHDDYGGRKMLDPVNGFFFKSIHTGNLCYDYNIAGTVNLLDTDNPTVGADYVGCIDYAKNLSFFGDANGAVRSYLYSNDGIFGSPVAKINHWDVSWGQAIDIINQVVISAQDDWGIGSTSYTDNGTLTNRGNYETYDNYPRNVAVDSTNRVAFASSGIKNQFTSYKYTTVGVCTWKEDKPLTGSGGRISVDGTRRIGFIQSGTIIYPFTYDSDGTNIEFKTPYDTGGTVGDMEIDTDQLVLFVANTGNQGMELYRYHSITGELTLLDSWTDSTNGFNRISVDFINRIILLSTNDDLDFLTYE